MSRKKRVYELAKELGLSGQELATKLKGLGISEVKSHMTAMDDALLLRVQGTLEAHGIAAESDSGATVIKSGGLTVRKRKKKKPAPEPEAPAVAEEAPAVPELTDLPTPTEAEAPAPQEVAAEQVQEPPVAAEPPKAEVQAEAPPVVAETPEVSTPEAPAKVTAPKAAPAPKVEKAPEAEAAAPAAKAEAPKKAEEPVVAETPAVSEPEPAKPVEVAAKAPESTEAKDKAETPAAPKAPAEAAKPVEAKAEAETAPAKAEAQSKEASPAAPEAPAEPSASTEAADGAAKPTEDKAKSGEAAAKTADKKPADDGIVRPSSKRRAGKVVGFVDLSKIQTNTPRKPDSRRLRSKDDVTPDVKPTLGHDRKRTFLRGDTASRGTLTSGQLREKEASRFLRSRRPVQGGAGRGRGRGRLRSPEVSISPHSGGEISLEAPVTIRHLAEGMSLKVNQLLPKAAQLLGWGITNNTTLDSESAILLASEFNVDLNLTFVVAAEEALLKDLTDERAKIGEDNLVRRAPVVAFMGHVDHGKTTLLDFLRSSRVTQGEAGGITQHIGAYQVDVPSGGKLTILDTPGHQAFTAMRARGAQATDICVLVVAADDGVMPSTVEALAHVQAASAAAEKAGQDKTPIVVAINKMDKPEANAEKVRTELAQRGLNPEEWGGETAMIEVSALEGTNIDSLLERIFLESEVLEKNLAHPEGPAEGIVLEAEIQEGKGKVAYLLVQDGTLNQGDIILAGEGYGRVRSIHNDIGKLVKTAGPSTPVEVSGLSELPTVGEQFHVVPKLLRAKEVAEERARKNRQMSLAERSGITKDALAATLAAQKVKTINVIVKADVQGSLQAVVSQLDGLKHEEVEIKVLHSALGGVTESDVDLSSSTEDCRILAFNIGVKDKARLAADRANIEVLHYTVIYELLDDMRAIMEGTLSPSYNEEITGHAEVKRVFKSSKFGNIPGCVVLDGTINRNNKLRIIRDGETVHTGTFSSIRREKDEVKEVREGFECGLLIKDYNDTKEGDVIESFKMVAVKRLLKI